MSSSPRIEAVADRSELVRGALEAVRARGLKVVPRCDFVRAYMAKHPEFGDLLA